MAHAGPVEIKVQATPEELGEGLTEIEQQTRAIRDNLQSALDIVRELRAELERIRAMEGAK